MCAALRKFAFALAKQEDDDELRALLRQIAMPGDMTLTFQREPSFMLAEQAGNITSQIIVCKDHQKDQIVGTGSRSIRLVYLDGKPMRIGYLSMLRGIPQARGNIGLARGYHYLHQLHADKAVPYYFTTILDENTQAQSLLTSGRAGLPGYQPIAHLTTYLIPLNKRQKKKNSSDSVSRCEHQHLAEAVAFLQNWNSQYQLAPLYTLQDLLGQTTLLPCFTWTNLYIYREHNEIQGILGVWDQQSFKQVVVSGYSRRMQLARPLYNLYASFRRKPGLPVEGKEIKLLYATFVSGTGQVFAALLDQIRADWSDKGYDYLSVGICLDNELSQIAARYATQKLLSTVYLVYWADENILLPALSRPVHLEIATL